METYSKYPHTWYKLGLAYEAIGYKQRLKNIFIEWRPHKDKIIPLMNIDIDDNKQVI